MVGFPGPAEPILLDTNLLIYATYEDSPHYAMARELMDRAERRDFVACLAPQVLMEFYGVVTNPRRVRRALSPVEATREVEAYLGGGYRTLFPGPGTPLRAARLAREAGIMGRRIFDCLLAATALDNDVTLIYTADTGHFLFPGLRAVNPLR